MTENRVKIERMVKVVNSLENTRRDALADFRIRDVHLLGFIFIVEKSPHKGRLLQMGGAQGRPVVIRLVAGYFALAGKTVDIATSRIELARKFAEESRVFFSRLGLSVACLPSELEAGNPEQAAELNRLYQSDVICSPVQGLCLAHLEQLMLGSLVRARKKELLILDDVDMLSICEPGSASCVARPSYYETETLRVLNQVWKLFVRLWHQWKSSGFSVEAKAEKVTKAVARATSQIIGQVYNKKLRKMLARKAESWVASAIRACRLQNEVDYRIVRGEARIINPDIKRTGRSLAWVQELRFFLQKKHGIANCSFNAISLFESDRAFIREYKGQLAGLFETVGSAAYREFLVWQFNVDIFRISSVWRQLYEKKPPVVCKEQKTWFQKLLEEVEHCRRHKKRPLLVVFRSAEEAQSFDEILQRNSFRTRKYLRSDSTGAIQIAKIKKKSIILATEQGARTVDFKLSKLSKLHVVLTTFVPPSSRLHRQAFGHAAQNGRRGSVRMILNAEESPWLSKTVGRLSLS